MWKIGCYCVQSQDLQLRITGLQQLQYKAQQLCYLQCPLLRVDQLIPFIPFHNIAFKSKQYSCSIKSFLLIKNRQAVFRKKNLSQVIDRKYIDAKVIEAHIVPGKLLLTRWIQYLTNTPRYSRMENACLTVFLSEKRPQTHLYRSTH